MFRNYCIWPIWITDVLCSIVLKIVFIVCSNPDTDRHSFMLGTWLTHSTILPVKKRNGEEKENDEDIPHIDSHSEENDEPDILVRPYFNFISFTNSGLDFPNVFNIRGRLVSCKNILPRLFLEILYWNSFEIFN